jgi:hypothetical protein
VLGAVSGEARPEGLCLDRLPLSLSSQPKGDLEREIVVGGRVGVHLGCLHLVHRHGRLRLCLCSHRGQMNGDKLLIVLVRRAELGTRRADVPQLLPASAMDAALATSGGAVGGAVGGAIGGSFPDVFAQDGA